MGNKMKTAIAIALTAGVIGGCCYKKYETQVKETAEGIYSKTTTVVKKPFKNFYNWAKEGKEQANVQTNVEQVVQETYQSTNQVPEEGTNSVSSLESNIVAVVEEAVKPTNLVEKAEEKIDLTQKLEYLKTEYARMENLVKEGKLKEAMKLNDVLKKETKELKETYATQAE